ncbi:hypothetical protein HJFPF1_09443 [Paramyrothecium foliicola]|nr:hypothetical protein HJFPF1_09443 [Paramyrothecium foliicola]
MASTTQPSTCSKTAVNRNKWEKRTRRHKTFHDFPRLPLELRRMIWAEAIRPRGYSEIHYLSVTKCQDGRPPRYRRAESTRRRLSDPQPCNCDRCDPRRQEYSWQRQDLAAYRWDAALWDACEESRDVLRWHMSKKGEMPVLGSRCGRNDNGTFAVREAQLGGERFLRVNIEEDIFCLRFKKTEIEASTLIYWGKFLRELLCTECAVAPSKIAFEFDHSWNERMPCTFQRMTCEATPRGLMARAYEAYSRREIELDRIWLINHDLAPKLHEGDSTALPGRKGRYIYIQSGTAAWKRLPRAQRRQSSLGFVYDVATLELLDYGQLPAPQPGQSIADCLGTLCRVPADWTLAN